MVRRSLSRLEDSRYSRLRTQSRKCCVKAFSYLANIVCFPGGGSLSWRSQLKRPGRGVAESVETNRGVFVCLCCVREAMWATQNWLVGLNLYPIAIIKNFEIVETRPRGYCGCVVTLSITRDIVLCEMWPGCRDKSNVTAGYVETINIGLMACTHQHQSQCS